MATIEVEVPTISQMLKDKRADGSKVRAYTKIGVNATSYDQWEDDGVIPGDKYAPALAEYLETTEEDMVWLLYRNRKMRRRDMGVYLNSLHTVVYAHAA